MSWVKVGTRYVRDPIFYGKEWFLDCRAGEPTLVVHIYRDPTEASLLKRMRRILREHDIPATIVKGEESHRDLSPFPPRFKGLKNSASVRLEFSNLPLPEGLETHANVWANSRPEGEVLNECLESSVSDGGPDQKRSGS